MPKRLKESEATVILGIRMPSSLEFILRKAARNLQNMGYDVKKSQVARCLIEAYASECEALYKEKHPQAVTVNQTIEGASVREVI